MLAPGSILLETARPDEENRRTLFFSRPKTIIAAHHPSQVLEALDHVDREVALGHWVAGFIEYEAGFAFEQIAELGLAEEPILWFGVYDEPVPRSPAGFEEPAEAIALDPVFTHSAAEYERKIRSVKEFLVEGDTYQINLTGSFEFDFDGSPTALYRHLRSRQPVGYNALIATGTRTIISCSPELFFRRDGNAIWTRPMKGTVDRGRNEAEDRALSNWLREDPKTKAENLMIVDLLRNDLSRVTEFGSVVVDNMFRPEIYETVIQMTTTVTGRLRRGTTYGEIFRAIFPSGSVTGAPKVRSMQIIHELEGRRRGVYTGTIGYIDPDRRAVFSVAIRTLSLTGSHGKMGCGGGIVWDSQPDAEYREALLKGVFLTGQPHRPDLIETMLWDDEFLRYERHMDRLERSARALSRPFDRGDVDAVLQWEAGRFQSGPMKVRMLLAANGEISVTSTPYRGPVVKPGTIAVSSVRMDPDDQWLYHKSTHRDVYEAEYHKAVRAGHVEVIFLNDRGEVTEGARTNVFVRMGDRLLTPPIRCGVLAGTRRAEVLETDPNASEAILTLSDLRQADEILLCNAATPLTPVTLTTYRPLTTDAAPPLTPPRQATDH